MSGPASQDPSAPAPGPAPAPKPSRRSPDGSARDRETVRRALRAGGVVWLAVVLPLGGSSVARRGFATEAAVLVAAIALILGGLAASAWLVLAALLDVRAGEPPGLRRWLWTLGLLVLTVGVVPAAAGLLAG